MKAEHLLNAHVQLKKMQNLLNEVQDLSQQLAEATDRGDEVTVHMLLAMRREPINGLTEANKLLATLQSNLPAREAQRLEELLNGSAALVPEEKGFAEQVAANRRQLERILALDQRINQKLSGKDSVYGS